MRLKQVEGGGMADRTVYFTVDRLALRKFAKRFEKHKPDNCAVNQGGV